MLNMNKTEYINELIIDSEWRLSRKFIREIEDEIERQHAYPVAPKLMAKYLQFKWIEYSRLN